MERINNITYGLCHSWLLLLGYCCFCLVSNKRIGVEGSHAVDPEFQFLNKAFDDQNVSAKGKPSYHFRPRQYWINDPNGPMYYNGMYHLFYQHNPSGSVWNNGIIWAHAVSKDLINWNPKGPAIYPTKPYDQNGCWSGSATVVPGKGPVIFYTGVDHQNREFQSYAVPANLSDPDLQVWLKPDNNPLINAPAVRDHINASAIRDPTTAWLRNGQWEMLVGTKWNRRGIAALYKSRDLMTWTLADQPLHSVDGTGMWECPDFFPVLRDGNRSGLDTSSHGDHVKHVLKVSLDETRYDCYTLGKYDVVSDRYVPDSGSAEGRDGLRYDYGNFYASKTFFDGAKGRRVVWGWANESDMAADDVQKGWAGVMPIPRTVWLDRGGKQLLLWPVEEVETLRAEKVQMRQRPLKMGEIVEIKGITAAQADVEVVFSLGSLQEAERLDRKWANNGQGLCDEKGSKVVGGIGPFGLLTLASEDLQEFTPVFFRIFKAADEGDKHVVLMCSDATSSSLGDNLYRPSFAGFVDADLSHGTLSLRSLIDHSIVESFGEGGKTCITSRVYPTKALRGDAHLYAFNNGSSTVTVQQLNAWSIRDAGSGDLIKSTLSTGQKKH